MARIKSAVDDLEQENDNKKLISLFSPLENLETVDPRGVSDFDYGFDDVIRVPPRNDCVYTNGFKEYYMILFHSEENVWILIDEVRKTQPHLLRTVYAIFISNENQVVPIWEQKVGHGDDKDYHVFLLYHNGQRSSVYDLDSSLPFPTDFNVYSSKAIRSNRKLLPQYHRVIPGKTYLQTFSSDRSHMRKPDGTYKSPPPEYPCIQVDDCTNNITDFISMDPSVGVGQIMSVPQFFRTFMPVKKP
uniref:Protein N-terminal glutamine amidohydrolase n=1 Tax=Strigamia maritima TaxID=126957 RepID=T1J4H8_STRMM